MDMGGPLRANSHEMTLKPQQKRSSTRTAASTEQYNWGCMERIDTECMRAEKDPKRRKTYWENFLSVFSHEPSAGVSGALGDEAIAKNICS